MNNYEILYVLKPTLTDEETAANIAKIEAILVREGAEILATNNMGMRKLAYPVEKNERGVYTIVYFKSEGTVISELERNLKFNEEVIKYLTVRYTKVKEVAQFEKLVTAANKIAEAKVEEAVVEQTPTEEPITEEPTTEAIATETETATETKTEA
ncbi:MAG: 30S ribosomal protein S6 [Sulfurovum sp.]|nr:MAG: 30S ribosomal protein S6 [Sulfurovum sp.]